MVVSPCVAVIVDDHNHVLPEIHLAIRQRRLPFDKLGFVHIDAHPDLSFLQEVDPSRIIYQPDELYQALDSSISGIAEFIWPLMYAGHVTRFLWIQSPWSNQMYQMSEQKVAVGKNFKTKRLGVTSCQCHMQDEKLFARESDLVPDTIKYVDLHVRKATAFRSLPRIQEIDMHLDLATLMSEKECNTREALSQVTELSENGYILDIDLDYFSTWNPLYLELVKECGLKSTRMLYCIFHKYLRYKGKDQDITPELRIEEQRRFEIALKAVEKACTMHLETEQSGYSQKLLYGEIRALIPFYYKESESAKLLDEFYQLLLRSDQKTRDMVWNAGPCLDQPHYEASKLEIDYLIEDLKKVFAEAYLLQPQLITIAKSTQDRFLPPHQLVYVLDGVLEMLRDMFGPLNVREVRT
uniref:Uncharacterized protein AlNc14C3G447 n=1 Tax=Albugo laibachii Nc14 TaxID=890382 RepID=F0VZW9_9STRA|nr:conserved hypothetical protein [Albugo laibachii Nc14]|eukprot:CCA14340.1 conserved hypothetical protein [Albugo laibachii Nc14]